MIKTAKTIVYNGIHMSLVKLPAHLIGFQFYRNDLNDYYPALNANLEGSISFHWKLLSELPKLEQKILRIFGEGLPSEYFIYLCSALEGLPDDTAFDMKEPPEPCRTCPILKRKGSYCQLDIRQHEIPGKPALRLVVSNKQLT